VLAAVSVAAVVAFGAVLLATVATGASPFTALFPASVSCSVTVHHENAADDAIQSAINTYPGGTICIGSGTFPEQLTITAPGTTINGAGAAKTIIEPNGPLALNTYDFDSGPGPLTPAAAIILVEGSSGDVTTGISGVTIQNLEVNGLAGQSTFTGCGDNFYGVDFQASSGTLTESGVVNVQLPVDLFGCQDGLAVYAYNGFFNYGSSAHAPDAVTISHTSISQFDKNGVTCDDPSETCTISSNTVTGIGPTPLIAQNGVQVAFGAKATVNLNTVSSAGNYTGAGGCTNETQGFYETCSDNEGAGILLYDAASGSSVASNTLTSNEYGVYAAEDGDASNGYSGPVTLSIEHNTVDSSVAYGIVGAGSPGGLDSFTISSNTVNDESSENSVVWGAPGILVDTGVFTLHDNSIKGSSTAALSSDNASQEVCGPNAGANGPYLTCTSAVYLTTAAIQAASESGYDQTNVTLSGNAFSSDSDDLATVGVLGGAVNLVET
jgi:parallel beta-helix repeat protein